MLVVNFSTIDGPFSRSVFLSGQLLPAGTDGSQTFKDFVSDLLHTNKISDTDVESTSVELFNNIDMKGQSIKNLESQSIKTVMDALPDFTFLKVVTRKTTIVPAPAKPQPIIMFPMFKAKPQVYRRLPNKKTGNLKTPGHIYNNIVSLFETQNVGFADGEWEDERKRRAGKHSDLESGRGHAFIQCLAATLSLISQHTATLANRGHTIPAMFKPCVVVKKGSLGSSHGKAKKKVERLNTERLEVLVGSGSGAKGSFQVDGELQRKARKALKLTKMWKDVATAVREFTDGLRQYVSYAKKENERRRMDISSSSTSSSVEDTYKLFEKVRRTFTVAERYRELEQLLSGKDEFEPINITDEIMGSNVSRFLGSRLKQQSRRQNYLKNFHSSYHLQVLIIAGHGPNPDVVNVWKILPPDNAEATTNQLRNFRAAQTIVQNIDHYHTKQEIQRTQNHIRALLESADTKAVNQATSMILQLMGIKARRRNQHYDDNYDKELMLQWEELSDSEQMNLVLDRRSGNGSEQRFVEWVKVANELIQLIGTATHDRRHNNKSYLSELLSVPDFITRVKEYWEDTYSAKKWTQSQTNEVNPFPEYPNPPSQTTVGYMFTPSNNFVGVGNFGGRLNVARTIQHNTGRLDHQDAHYGFAQRKLVRSLVIRLHKLEVGSIEMIGMDDKKKDPIGQPDHPLSASVRPHGKKIVPVAKHATEHTDRTSSSSHALHILQSQALDHDFGGWSTLTPGTILIPDIPGKITESWYSGHIYVSLSESIFNPSRAMGHSAVLGQLWLDRAHLRGGLPKIALEDFAIADYSIQETYLEYIPPIIVLTTDGGADHNIKFIQTQAALLGLLKIFDLYAIVGTNSVPSKSSYEPVERANSALNGALQHTCSEREKCLTPSIESVVVKCGSQKQLRKAAAKDDNVRLEYVASLQQVRKEKLQRFSRVKLQGNNVIPVDSSTHARVAAVQNAVLQEVSSFDSEITTQNDALTHMPEFSNRLLHDGGMVRRYLVEIRGPNCKRISQAAKDAWGRGVPPPWKANPTDAKYLNLAETEAIEAEGVVLSEAYKPVPPSRNKAGSTKGKKVDQALKVLHPGVFNQTNICEKVKCNRCNKVRPVYYLEPGRKNGKVDGVDMSEQLQITHELFPFTCGAPLVPDGRRFDGLRQMFTVRQSYTCAVKMDSGFYFAVKNNYWPNCCVDCGTPKDLVVEERVTMEGKKCRVQCSACAADPDILLTPYGKTPSNSINKLQMGSDNMAGDKIKMEEDQMEEDNDNAANAANDANDDDDDDDDVINIDIDKNKVKKKTKKRGQKNSLPNTISNRESFKLRCAANTNRLKYPNRIDLFNYPLPPHRSRITITDFDRERVEKQYEYLSDTGVELPLMMIQDRPELQDALKKCHFFNTFFYTRFLTIIETAKNKGMQQPTVVAYNAIKKWFRGVNVFEKQFLLFPINFQEHWSLAIACNPAEIKFYLDSAFELESARAIEAKIKDIKPNEANEAIEAIKDSDGEGNLDNAMRMSLTGKGTHHLPTSSSSRTESCKLFKSDAGAM
mgnify:CR=1 FL=1